MLILSRRRSAAAFFNMEFVMPDNESAKFNVEEERVDSLSLSSASLLCPACWCWTTEAEGRSVNGEAADDGRACS